MHIVSDVSRCLRWYRSRLYVGYHRYSKRLSGQTSHAHCHQLRPSAVQRVPRTIPRGFRPPQAQGNGIDQHCQAWDATTATDVCEEVHRTGRLMVAGMCRHLHQHLIRAGFGIGMHPTKRHSSQRTGSVAKLAQYRFRRILVYVGGTLPVVVSNRNGCGMRRQRYGKAARQTGTVNQHISHGLRTILASISDPNRHGGLTYYMSQHMRPAAHHHRNNRSGGQCHDFVQHFILVPSRRMSDKSTPSPQVAPYSATAFAAPLSSNSLS